MINTTELSRIGFTVIRNILSSEGNTKMALDLAETLHNMPNEGNQFLEEMMVKRLNEFIMKYPDLKNHFLDLGLEFD